MTSWTDTFTYGTEIAYDFTNILLKYWKNLDLDASSSLNRDEFRISYAKMALLAAHVEMDILDSDSDGIIQGNDLKTFTTLTQRAANVVLPSKFFVFLLRKNRQNHFAKMVLKKTADDDFLKIPTISTTWCQRCTHNLVSQMLLMFTISLNSIQE